MGYTTQKVGLCFSTLMFWLGFNIFLVIWKASGTFLLLAFIGITLLSGVILIRGWAKIKRYQTQNFEWYKTNYGGFFRANRIHCRHCESPKVHVRNILRRSFTREHFCAQCGKTLYFSPEKN